MAGEATTLTHHDAQICEHFRRAAELIGKRWTPQIIRGLLSGSSRYSNLKAGVGQISHHMLSERLKELEACDIVSRQVVPSTPVRVEYGLTERGRDLAGVIEELGGWAERWGEEATSPARGSTGRRRRTA
jgi:DNA-binding HxlR family transcriptional regulator